MLSPLSILNEFAVSSRTSAPIPNFASLRGILWAKFGIKGALAVSMLASAAYGFEFPTRGCRELIGNSNPPH
jgi:hypothetical protein